MADAGQFRATGSRTDWEPGDPLPRLEIENLVS
jgi:hypothetical protein